MPTFVTAASSNHFKSLCQFLGTVIGQDVYVYDLGLSQSEVHHIRSTFNIVYRVFQFDKYPEFVKLTSPDAGAYAWKPILIADVYSETQGTLIWCDAGNKLTDLNALLRCIEEDIVYTPTSANRVIDWTHPTALSAMDVSMLHFNKQMRNAAIVGFKRDVRSMKLISDWRSYALNKHASLPSGANRNNHRHDQSILTVLYYRHLLPRTRHTCEGVTIHNDID
jgi:hypothetical protein